MTKSNDKQRALGKASEIKGLDIAGFLLKWFALDDEGQQVFADKLGMPIDMLMETAEGIKWIINH